MTWLADNAHAFFDACETGKGWEVCKAYCTPDATFNSQAEPLEGITTLEGYTEWMKGLLGPIPDGRYDLQALGVDDTRKRVLVFGVFHGTHTAEGGPVPPTGKTVAADYVYVMSFDGEKIRHMTKIWNAPWSLRELGWG